LHVVQGGDNGVQADSDALLVRLFNVLSVVPKQAQDAVAAIVRTI
jgi:hypothetical protein